MGQINMKDLHKIGNSMQVAPRFNEQFEVSVAEKQLIDNFVSELIRRGYFKLSRVKQPGGVTLLNISAIIYKKEEKNEDEDSSL